MKWIPLLLLLAFAAGCGNGNALEKASASIRAEMNEDQVRQIFKGFRVTVTNEVGVLEDERNINHRETGNDIDWKIHLLGTNKSYAYKLDFLPNSFGDWSSCSVFFDTNKILVGYSYMAIH